MRPAINYMASPQAELHDLLLQPSSRDPFGRIPNNEPKMRDLASNISTSGKLDNVRRLPNTEAHVINLSCRINSPAHRRPTFRFTASSSGPLFTNPNNWFGRYWTTAIQANASRRPNGSFGRWKTHTMSAKAPWSTGNRRQGALTRQLIWHKRHQAGSYLIKNLPTQGL